MIKAIETRYKGYRFRSRLEARWAVFFDSFGIEYEYEVEGFEKDGYRYLPDFYLPESETFVEVKGSLSGFDADKMAYLIEGDSIFDIDDGDMYMTPGLLMLGNIPHVDRGIAVHPLITHDEGLHKRWAMFQCGTVKKIKGDYLSCLLLFSNNFYKHKNLCIDGIVSSGDTNDAKKLFNPEPIITIKSSAQYNNSHGVSTLQAYNKARSARFEHGETPC